MLAEVLEGAQRGALQEVTASGVARAAQGLSEMVGREIGITAPELSAVDINQVAAVLEGPEEMVVGVYLAVSGSVTGHILILLSPEEARSLVDMVMGQPDGTTYVLGPMERSALGEVGNLTGSFFLTALAEATGLESQPSPPAVIADMGCAILDIPLVALALTSEEVLVITTIFSDSDRQIKASFLVMPDLSSMRAIVGALEANWRRH